MKYYAKNIIAGETIEVKVISFTYDSPKHLDDYSSRKEVEIIEGKFKGKRAIIEAIDLIRVNN